MRRRVIDDLGARITIEERSLEGKIGFFDARTGLIAIERAQPEAAKHIVLLHEALHLVAEMLVQAGVCKRQPDHAFISSAAPNLLAFLVCAGFWRGVTKREVIDFLRSLPKPKKRRAKRARTRRPAPR